MALVRRIVDIHLIEDDDSVEPLEACQLQLENLSLDAGEAAEVWHDVSGLHRHLVRLCSSAYQEQLRSGFLLVRFVSYSVLISCRGQLVFAIGFSVLVRFVFTVHYAVLSSSCLVVLWD